MLKIDLKNWTEKPEAIKMCIPNSHITKVTTSIERLDFWMHLTKYIFAQSAN